MLITQGSLVRIQSGPLRNGGVPGDVAQLGERRLCKADVGGSSPPGSTRQDPGGDFRRTSAAEVIRLEEPGGKGRESTLRNE